MNAAVASVICSIVFGTLGFVVSYVALQRNKKKEDSEEGQSRGVIASDVGYIKARVDEFIREFRELRAAVGELNERVTRVEESSKQAHHRIDEIYERINERKD